MQTYADRLRESAQKTGSIVCLGLDPDFSKIPVFQERDPPAVRLGKYFGGITDAVLDGSMGRGEDRVVFDPKPKVGMVKSNYAFWAEHGFDSLAQMRSLMRYWQNRGTIVTLDSKRGDIGKTAESYARESFDFYMADAVTVNPLLGGDSVRPFFKRAAKDGKGVYVLVRTSNPGAKDFQDVMALPRSVQEKFYMAIAYKTIEWSKEFPGTVGMVVGATAPEELENVAQLIVEKEVNVPLLIPGVGTQGGSISDVIGALQDVGYEKSLARINSSSGITYAWEKTPEKHPHDFIRPAIDEINRLNAEIGAVV